MPSWMDSTRLTLLGALLFAGPAWGQFAPDVMVADRYLAPDGSIQSNMTISFSHGKIRSIRPGKPPANAERVIHHPNAVVFPGLIDVRSTLGTLGTTSESALSIDPAASAVDLIDVAHRDFRLAIRAGVTTVMVAPAANNLVSGVAATFKTAAVVGHERFVRSDGPLMFALGSSVWQPDRAPTSRIGSLAMLRESLEDARAGRGHERLVQFMAGGLDGIVVCEESQDVSAALRTFGGGSARFHIVYAGDAHDLARELRGKRPIIVVGPFGLETPPGTIAFAATMAGENVPVVFAGGSPGQGYDSLRLSAALAVRYGMDPADARLAITSRAAELAGVGDRVGSLRPGYDADLVVFSDDPLRLDARILEVYVSGVRVFRESATPLQNERNTR
ncbi:MAG: amidohydrolase family protein [Planctomycetes bacterium]|nr:amidohydrolase family protein [Planctomycetota bacterium]